MLSLVDKIVFLKVMMTQKFCTNKKKLSTKRVLIKYFIILILSIAGPIDWYIKPYVFVQSAAWKVIFAKFFFVLNTSSFVLVNLPQLKY